MCNWQNREHAATAPVLPWRAVSWPRLCHRCKMWMIFSRAFPCSCALYFLDRWTEGQSQHATSWNFGQREIFSDYACKFLFNTNCSKIWLWVSQCEDLKLKNVPWCLVLWLFLPPVKWENAPLVKERGFVWRNECDDDGSIQTSRWAEQGLSTALCVRSWALGNRKRTACWLAVHKLSTFQRVPWRRWVS